MTKKMIYDQMKIGHGDLDGTLIAVKEQIEEWISRFGESAYMDVYLDSDSNSEIAAEGREETDDEYEIRLEAERVRLEQEAEFNRKRIATRAAQLEATERAEFERLKAKYGN